MKLDVREKKLESCASVRNLEWLRDRTVFEITLSQDGLTGTGEAAPLSGWTESCEDCRQALEEFNPRTLEDVRNKERCLLLFPAARHGLSQARLDLEARRQDVPLASFLGDTNQYQRSVSVYASLPFNDRAVLREELFRATDQGFGQAKIKFQGDPDELRDLLLYLHDKSNSSPDLRVDLNESWRLTDITEGTLQYLRDHLDYLEQPFDREDLEEHRRLRKDLDVKVALDESLRYHRPEVFTPCEAADYWVVKPMVLGGLDLAWQWCKTARQSGVKPVVTTVFEGIVGRSGALHLAGSFPDPLPPCGLATGRFVKETARNPLDQPEEGLLEIGSAPGLGGRIRT